MLQGKQVLCNADRLRWANYLAPPPGGVYTAQRGRRRPARLRIVWVERGEYVRMDRAEDHMWWYRALHARLCDALGGVSGLVLDAGCGTGGLLARLRRLPGIQPIGLEWSMDAAGRAAGKSAAPVVRGDVNCLPFATASFEAAIAADVLCHAAVDPPLALAELRRVLRPGGLLVLNLPAYAWLLSAHDRRVHNARRHTVAGVRAALARAGFTGIAAGYWNGLLLPLMLAERKLLARDPHAASDVAAFPPWLDALLHAVTVLERRLKLHLPAGGSVFATAIRPRGIADAERH
jgi:SAM-dependent methyltransferase